MLALITSVYGNYDSLKASVPQSSPVEMVCVTDDPDLEVDGWRILVVPRTCHPNLAAKQAKACPWVFTQADSVVWIDGSFRVTSPTFVCDVLELADPIAQFVHPWRSCVYDEAEVSIGMPKYAGLPCLEQVERYREFHPTYWGLWASGVIARHRCQVVEEFGRRWLDECEQWTFQDQLSEAPMLNLHGLRPTELPGNHLANEWLSFEPSGEH